MPDLIQHDADVFTVADLFSADECEALIARAESIGFEPASVRTSSGQKMMTKIRNNDRVVVVDPKLAADMWDRVRDLLPSLDAQIPTGVDDTLRFYRYFPGQKFNRHKDGAVTNDRGETSKLSYLVYLNDCDGGQTEFRDYVTIGGERTKTVTRIEPLTGSCLLFRHERWHEGLPVNTGRKYVLRTDIFYSVGAK